MNAMQPKHLPKLHHGKPVPQWSSGLSVGNAKLDEQHITLLELGRDLMRLLDTDPATKDQIHGALEDPRWPLKVPHLWPVKLLHPGHRELMC